MGGADPREGASPDAPGGSGPEAAARAADVVRDAGVVVTGAARGIGAAIATMLAEGGARVVVNDLDAAALQETAARIGAHPVAGDAASPAGAARLVEAAAAHLGDVDIWFGNAGVETGRGLATSEDDWALSIDVNVMAHVRAARLLVPGWLERGRGRYVVTASAAGLLTMLGAAPYSVTKHGAVAFAEWLSATYGHRGVVVQAICPQGVRTAMYEAAGPVQSLLSVDGTLEPEDVARTVFEALGDDRFLVLPHPSVGTYYAHRAADTDRWLSGMRRIQARLDEAGL